MNKRSAIFISIEGMGTNLIGAYGNSIAPTPRLDSLASNSIILDQLWNDSLTPANVLRSWLSGLHQLESENQPATFSPWLEAIGQAFLVTDSELIANSDAADHVSRVLLVDKESQSLDGNEDEFSESERSEKSVIESANESELEFEYLLQAALGAWHANRDDHPVLWIHSKGLAGDWDAPYELREMLCDEEDPQPPRDTSPMSLKITQKTDPDEVFQISCAVGGQMMAYDQAIGECFDMLQKLNDDEQCLFAVLGTNGYPLGEHGEVGHLSRQLYSESLHVPCILHTGSVLPLGIRISINLQPHQVGNLLNDWFTESIDSQDLYDRLLEAFNAEVDGESPLGNAIAVEGQRSYLCCPAWSLHSRRDDSEQEAFELFAKPDDRWEQNDISTRAPIVLEKMCVLRDKLKNYYSSDISVRQPVNWIDEDLTKLHR